MRSPGHKPRAGRRIRILSAETERSMTDIIIQAVEEYLRRRLEQKEEKE